MVKINGDDWKIVLTSSNHPALLKPDNSYTLGCCDNKLKKIFIVEGLTDAYFKKVVSHELVHACMYSYDVELDDYQEEILADLIATYGSEIMNISNSIFCRLRGCKKNKGSLCQ